MWTRSIPFVASRGVQSQCPKQVDSRTLTVTLTTTLTITPTLPLTRTRILPGKNQKSIESLLSTIPGSPVANGSANVGARKRAMTIRNKLQLTNHLCHREKNRLAINASNPNSSDKYVPATVTVIASNFISLFLFFSFNFMFLSMYEF